MSLKIDIFKGQGRVAFGMEVFKNQLFLHIKVPGKYQKSIALTFLDVSMHETV
jgi:hypothetical protein